MHEAGSTTVRSLYRNSDHKAEVLVPLVLTQHGTLARTGVWRHSDPEPGGRCTKRTRGGKAADEHTAKLTSLPLDKGGKTAHALPRRTARYTRDPSSFNYYKLLKIPNPLGSPQGTFTWGVICQWSGANISVMRPECFTLTISLKMKTKMKNQFLQKLLPILRL